jgi:hypothetical protein
VKSSKNRAETRRFWLFSLHSFPSRLLSFPWTNRKSSRRWKNSPSSQWMHRHPMKRSCSSHCLPKSQRYHNGDWDQVRSPSLSVAHRTDKMQVCIMRAQTSRPLNAPYVVLTLGDRVRRTTVAKPAAEWNESFEFTTSFHAQLFGTLQARTARLVGTYVYRWTCTIVDGCWRTSTWAGPRSSSTSSPAGPSPSPGTLLFH